MRVFPVIRKASASNPVDGTTDTGTQDESDGAHGVGVESIPTGTDGQSGTDTHDADLTVPTGSTGASHAQTDVGVESVSTGSTGASADPFSGVLAAQSTGSTGASMADDLSASGTFPTGASGASVAQTDSGVESVSTGSTGASHAQSGVGADSVSTGSTGASSQADSTVLGVGYTTAVAHTLHSGSKSWSNQSNATGFEDSVVASIQSAASPTAAASHDAELFCKTFAVPTATPSGWTRSKVEVVDRFACDCAVGSLSSASFTVVLYDSVGASLGTLRSFSTGNTQTLQTRTMDVTSLVSGLSDADLAGVQVGYRSTCNLLVVTGGNAGGDVDSCYLRITYTRTGLT